MKRTLLIIYILIAVLLIKINVWAQGEIISPAGIISMAQINNFQEQRYVRIKLAELFESINSQIWIRNEVADISLKDKPDLPDIGPIQKISDSIEREAELLSKNADKYI